ncbi:MAG: hypothetical protein ER33_04775 [Cyanobium sp. CACIAM 14]|nr:MAG: hypothetical protein ER33_04775 [Cyanobium sp. CACIAM 14]
MLLPGSEAWQLTIYLGWQMHGVPGGMVAGGLFELHSVVVPIGLANLFVLWCQPLVAMEILRLLYPLVEVGAGLAGVLHGRFRPDLLRPSQHRPCQTAAVPVPALAAAACRTAPWCPPSART